jgi:hypothetical protein
MLQKIPIIVASEAYNMPAGARLRFNLDNFDTAAAVTPGSGFYNSTTSYEYRIIRAGWGSFFSYGNVSFYRGFQVVEKPW